ncbi:MAG: transcription termination factor Rho, partial [Planctomycetes bacterium]|nr:transcription termination factor Rho [Planctomycetota bacterium]
MIPEENKGTEPGPESGAGESGDADGKRRYRRGRRRRRSDGEQGELPFPAGENTSPVPDGGGDRRPATRGRVDRPERSEPRGERSQDRGGRNHDRNGDRGNDRNNDRGGKKRRGRRKRTTREGVSNTVTTPVEVPEDQLVRHTGLFDPQNDGSGHIRFSENYYLVSEDDVFVPRDAVRRYEIRSGAMIELDSAPPRKRGGRRILYRIHSINQKDPELHREEVLFKSLLPCDPYERFHLETAHDPDISMRIIDLLTPIGRGQRSLIVAPPRSGKTVILQKMANAIAESHPEVKVVILLIDERPEEVTDFKRNTTAEVVASCLDEGSANHVRVTEMVLEKLRCQVEAGHHVVCLLDSITRLGRAYNNETKHSGRILSGGVDAKTLAKPKAFFGAARTIENGGSLTIIATALVDTGSRMDQVIFEEFKGTGNMELVLSRQLANNRIFPAIDIAMSGTRKEEKLLDPAIYKKVNVLRRVLNQLKPNEAMRLLIERMEKTQSNDE